MCHGVQIIYRCCGKRQNRVIAGGRCEDYGPPCGTIWGRAMTRGRCTSCMRRRIEEERREREVFSHECFRAKAVDLFFRGERITPLTDSAAAQNDREEYDRCWDQWKARNRLHPFPRWSPYIDVLRQRFDGEARVGASSFALVRPQLWEECLRRQEELDASPRIINSIDGGFDFSVVLHGRRTADLDAIPTTEPTTAGYEMERNLPQEILPHSSRVSPPLPLPIGTVAELPASVDDIFRHQRTLALSTDSIRTEPPSKEEEEEEEEEYWPYQEPKRRYAGNDMVEAVAFPLDVEDYMDYLGLLENTASMILDTRFAMKTLKIRPFSFYPSTTPGRRQVLPLSAWLTVQYCDGQESTYITAIEEYKLYIQESGTPQQYNEYLDCLDQHAAVNRQILAGELAQNSSLWILDRIQPTAPIVWVKSEEKEHFFEFLRLLWSGDESVALPLPSQEPSSLEALQTEVMLREALETSPGEIAVIDDGNRRFIWTGSDDGSDDDNADLPESPASPARPRQFVWTGSDDGNDDGNDDLPEPPASPARPRQFVWTDGNDDGNDDLPESPASPPQARSPPQSHHVSPPTPATGANPIFVEDMQQNEDANWDRTRALFRRQEEEENTYIAGPWRLVEAENEIIVTLDLDSESEEEYARRVRRDLISAGVWHGRDSDRRDGDEDSEDQW